MATVEFGNFEGAKTLKIVPSNEMKQIKIKFFNAEIFIGNLSGFRLIKEDIDGARFKLRNY